MRRGEKLGWPRVPKQALQKAPQQRLCHQTSFSIGQLVLSKPFKSVEYMATSVHPGPFHHSDCLISITRHIFDDVIAAWREAADPSDSFGLMRLKLWENDGWWTGFHKVSGLTDANTMQPFECQTEVHLCLCDTCLYIAGMGGVGGGCI